MMAITDRSSNFSETRFSKEDGRFPVEGCRQFLLNTMRFPLLPVHSFRDRHRAAAVVRCGRRTAGAALRDLAIT